MAIAVLRLSLVRRLRSGHFMFSLTRSNVNSNIGAVLQGARLLEPSGGIRVAWTILAPRVPAAGGRFIGGDSGLCAIQIPRI